MEKKYTIEEIREKLKNRHIHIIPYAHPDYAWTHYRQWHVERYILIINEVLDIMKNDPDFTWMTDNLDHMIAPFIKYCPSRVEELGKRVMEGRIEITNGIVALIRSTQSGDETFIRNIVLGKRYFGRLFPGVDISVYNNVDVSIGHSQLPQLLNLGGYKYFWGWRPQGALDYKGIPRQFVWKGLDGSGIISSRGFYGGLCGIEYLDRDFEKEWDGIVETFYNKELGNIVDHSSVSGLWLTNGMDDSRPLRDFTDRPSRIPEFVENWNRKEKCALSFSSARNYFERIIKDELPVVEGVLDPCDVGYNTPAKGEKGLWRMRKELDRLLVQAETLWSMAALTGERYPEERFDELWMLQLGISGHAMEFTLASDFEELYSKALAAKYHAEDLIRQAKSGIMIKIEGGSQKQLAVFNTLNWEREDIIPIHIAQPKGGKPFDLVDQNGNIVEYQVLELFKGDVPYQGAQFDEIDVLANVKVPALGYASLKVIERKNGLENESFGILSEDMDFKMEGGVCQTIDTGEIKVKFREGRITGILDKQDNFIYRSTECVSELGDIKFTRTRPHTEAAWMFISHHQGVEHFSPAQWSWEEYGPLRWKYVVKGNLGVHRVKQEITLYKGKKNIDFNVYIDCMESSTGFFSAEFPVEKDSKILADIPFGMEERNISNEPYGKVSDSIVDNIERFFKGAFYAKSWVNYNSKGYGNSLISGNCGNYYLLDEDTLSIILTRVMDYEKSEDWVRHTHPWTGCIGRHNFKYSLFVHSTGDELYQVAKLAKEKAFKLEVEAKIGIATEETLPGGLSMLDIQSGSAVISAFYREGDRYILRLYEGRGKSTELKIKSFVPMKSVEAVDFLGGSFAREGIIAYSDSYGFETIIKPWEIINLALEF